MDAYADALGIALPKRRAASVPVDDVLPPAQAGVTGDYVGDPTDVVEGIRRIADPQERANAQAALESQLRANGGKLRVQSPADSYAAALGVGEAPKQAPNAAPKSTQQITSPEMDLTAHAVSSLVAPVAGGLHGGARFLSDLITGKGLDQASAAGARAVQSTQDALTYTPRTEQGKVMAQGYDSNYNPAMWVPAAASWLGEKGGDALTDAGAPGAGAVVKGALTASPALIGMAPRGARMIRDLAKAPEEAVRIDPTMDRVPQAKVTTSEPNTIQQTVPAQPAPVARRAEAKSAAPLASEAPPVPTTPEAVQEVAQKAPSSLFPQLEANSSSGAFSLEEQKARARVLKSVGIDTARKSSLAGDGVGGSTDFQTAKLDTPAGRQMRSVIDNEKAALDNHSDSLVTSTGGTHGVDQSALYARGNTILAPLDGLKQWFDSRTSALYKAADERAQGTPTTLSTFAQTLGDASELTNSDRVHLQGAVNAYLKKLNMSGEDGSVAGSAQQAETIRKYLNEQWSPQNSRFVGKLKDALDEDVTASAGNDIYAEARKIRSLRGQTLDNPNGIAKLMDSSGPEGVNRAVPVEKIADSLTGMPVDQFAHVVKTLRESPPEIQPQAQAALSEIKAQFANKVRAVGTSQQGQWNAKGVTKYLRDNAARMAEVFTPEEIGQFRNLNDAGHIVAKDQSYPGAAVQGHNLMTHGVISGLPTAGAGVGGFVGGPVGAAIGGAAGRMAAGAVENAAQVRAVNKRTVPLSQLLDEGK